MFSECPNSTFSCSIVCYAHPHEVKRRVVEISEVKWNLGTMMIIGFLIKYLLSTKCLTSL